MAFTAQDFHDRIERLEQHLGSSDVVRAARRTTPCRTMHVWQVLDGQGMAPE
ncbi:MAG: hypothetical protein AB7N91_01960 [Candidatus Tectimicrobiota bacterium]